MSDNEPRGCPTPGACSAIDEIGRLKRELRDTRAALVMIRGVVAGALDDERPVGGEFA